MGFVPVPPEKCGNDLLKPIVGRGAAFADIDGDGDLDVVLTQIGGPPLLLRNDQNLHHHWIRLKLVGTKSNRDAIGAWIKVRVGGHTLSRQVMPTRSYLSQSELPVTIGLGGADKVDSVEITWPGGWRQKVKTGGGSPDDRHGRPVDGTDPWLPRGRPGGGWLFVLPATRLGVVIADFRMPDLPAEIRRPSHQDADRQRAQQQQCDKPGCDGPAPEVDQTRQRHDSERDATGQGNPADAWCRSRMCSE